VSRSKNPGGHVYLSRSKASPGTEGVILSNTCFRPLGGRDGRGEEKGGGHGDGSEEHIYSPLQILQPGVFYRFATSTRT
jgi:hypothetical protein